MAKRILVMAGVALLAIWGTVALAAGDGSAEHGAELYATYCIACHGPAGEGRAAHPAFAGNIRYDITFDEVVAAGVADTYMVAFGDQYGGPLSESDISDLRAYAQTWIAEPLPLPAAAVPADLSAELTAGAELYVTNCAGCHGPDGQGRGLENFPAIGSHIDVKALARRGVAGSMMPPFAEAYDGPLSEQELDSLVGYVRSWPQRNEMVAQAEGSPQGAGLLMLLIGLGAISIVALTGITIHRTTSE